MPTPRPGLCAEVAVDAATAPERTFTYSVPPTLQLAPGHVVWVPLGSQRVQGVVFELHHRSLVSELRPIEGVDDSIPSLSQAQLHLARWISHFYFSPLFYAAALLFPPGSRRRFVTFVRLSPTPANADAEGLPAAQRRIFRYLQQHRLVEEQSIRRRYGRAGGDALHQMVAQGLVEQQPQWQRPRVGTRYEASLRLTIPLEQRERLAQDLKARHAFRQANLVEYLAREGSLPSSQARKEFGNSTVRALLHKTIVVEERHRTVRDPLVGRIFALELPLSLTGAQATAFQPVARALDGLGPERTFLLEGVTGSGKTEVYLQAFERCISLGRRALFLVPEISLTPQFIQRLGSRFPGQVAVYHSGLSPGEQFDTWWRTKQGEFNVVLGPRSAIFLPQPDLGLIVIDEEHEASYKQEEATPRFHARDVALKLAELSGAVVLLGSATPDVTTYHRALRGDYRLLQLPGRIGVGQGGRIHQTPLAKVEIVDMRQDLKEGNRSIFSRALHNALASTLRNGEQAILFLNRRGASAFVQCRDCGYVVRCHRCDAAMTYHSVREQLVCHLCGSKARIPSSCPVCLSPRIRFLGLGTQRVVEEVRRAFGVEVLRWDRDTARERKAHDDLMARFTLGEAPVLVGTQMVAKGLHLPRVTLVGVVLADVGLHLPDVRAGERTFQLLCQVAGRAGRGEMPGRVILQTYSPDYYAIQAAASQDYPAFYQQEIAYRREHLNPPFSRLVRLLCHHTNAERCQREAEALGLRLRQMLDTRGLGEVELIGPAPAWPARVRGHYHWQIILRVPNSRADEITPLLERVGIPPTCIVDVDPMS